MTFQAGPKASDLPPTQEPIVKETAPKRGPGRPRKDGMPMGSGPSIRPSKASLETQIGSLLVMMNLFVMATPLRSDALDMYEVSALAKAIDQQCKQSPRFRKYVEAALGVGSGGALAGMILMIGARRVARHGMVPAEIDALLGSMIQTTVTKQATEASSGTRTNGAT